MNEKVYDITKAEVIKVFKKWNTEYLDNPSKWGEIEPGAEIQQAENFIEYLEEVKK